MINDKIQKNNKTGYKGVLQYRLADGSTRYQSYLTVGGKNYSKKGFNTPEEAYNYRLKLVEKIRTEGRHKMKADEEKIKRLLATKPSFGLRSERE
ncbi:hypothetical protein [Streptococcus dysgalactiae]|uniref:hypothetical protein n=1 Tax=Streptococcus dysgalactiae TaxID=1334 RepID=UPI0021B0B236|nr:hypothetical protein [Streptococcus dysgalactiae]